MEYNQNEREKMINKEDTVKRFNVHSDGMPEGRGKAGKEKGYAFP